MTEKWTLIFDPITRGYLWASGSPRFELVGLLDSVFREWRGDTNKWKRRLWTSYFEKVFREWATQEGHVPSPRSDMARFELSQARTLGSYAQWFHEWTAATEIDLGITRTFAEDTPLPKGQRQEHRPHVPFAPSMPPMG